MSDVFYERFTELQFKFFILLFIMLVTLQVTVITVMFQAWNLYYLFSTCACVVVLFIIKHFIDYREFKDKIGLYIPNPSVKNKSYGEHVDMNIVDEDTPVQVCMLYRNGMSFRDIMRELQLNHPIQVKRNLMEGLDVLLKEHN
ncbi:MAG: hypothetical protein U9O89_01375, partial [Thermoproteota archaeon]|nr:hypothetical protein [Thermoproteota archaeon]